MSVSIDDVPTLNSPILEWRGSQTSQLRASRRSVLKSAIVAGALGSLTGLAWFGPSTARAFANSGCTTEYTGAQTQCNPPYSGGYTPVGDTACWGTGVGYIGNSYCNGTGWHRRDSEGGYSYSRNCDSCASRNAWRWMKPGGNVYRCSDGETHYDSPGGSWTRFTICQQFISN